MIIYLNYTFSVPDKRLYTLYKGITVTHLVSASYGAPLHVFCSHMSWHPLDGAKAPVRATPLAPNRPMTPPRSQWLSRRPARTTFTHEP
jgi:hypothetical protein